MDKKQCNSCGKPKCSCKNKEFTKAVIEIDNPEQITLMRRVTIPASMGDDTTVPPVVGKYHNVLLYYEANHKSYLYSSDGIPTLLANGLTDYEQAVNLPEINGHTLLGNQTGPELDLQNTLSVIPDTGIKLENDELSGIPATDTTIGMVKPGAGLEADTDGTLSVVPIMYKASDLGLSETNDEATALSNYSLLKTAMEKGKNVLIDGVYYLKNTDNSNGIKIVGNQFLQGQNKDSKLITFDNKYLYLFDHNGFNLTISNLTFVNNYGHESFVIGDWSTNTVKTRYGSIKITGSSFIGDFTILNFYNAESNTRDETWGIPSVEFVNNFVDGSNRISIKMYNIPFGEVVINNNIIHNVKPVFGRFNPTHSEDASQGVAYMRMVKADGNTVTYDDNVFVSGATYCAFLVCVTNNAILTNNYISGLKSNDADVAVYSAYLSCLNVVFENNTCINCINFASNSNNFLFKAKFGEGKRIYRNNIVTLDRTWVNTINNAFDASYSESDLLANTTTAIFHSDGHQDEWIIDGNIINVLKINCLYRYRDITYFTFSNNEVNAYTLEGYLISPQTNNKFCKIINNVFRLSNDNASICLVQGADYNNTCDVEIVGNTIYNGGQRAVLISFGGTMHNINVENNNVYDLDSTASTSSSSRNINITGTYNILKLDGDFYSNNSTAMNRLTICNGKLLLEETVDSLAMQSNGGSERFNIDASSLLSNKLLFTIERMNSSNVFETTKYVVTFYNDGTNSYVTYTDTDDTVQDINLNTIGTTTIKNVKPDNGDSMLIVRTASAGSYITFDNLTANCKYCKIKIASI